MEKGPAADATDAPQAWGLLCNPVMKISFFIFPCNGAPVEWYWQGKTKVLGEEPVPVPHCPPQIPHGLTWDRTRTSAVGGWRLTAWAMARPRITYLSVLVSCLYSIQSHSFLQKKFTQFQEKSDTLGAVTIQWDWLAGTRSCSGTGEPADICWPQDKISFRFGDCLLCGIWEWL